MKRKLKAELVKMSTDIITSRNMNEITELYEAAKGLYEKIAVLKFIEEELKDIQVDVSKNVIAGNNITRCNMPRNNKTRRINPSTKLKPNKMSVVQC